MMRSSARMFAIMVVLCPVVASAQGIRTPPQSPPPVTLTLEQALQYAITTGRTFVIRVRGGRAEWVDVKTGLTSGTLVEVFGDLKSGDEIAARGTDELKTGTSVQVKQAKSA